MLSTRLETETEVWGTTVNIQQSESAFQSFYEGFLDTEGQPLYPRILDEAVAQGIYNINLNCRNLHDFAPHLYKELVTYPQELIPLFDLVINQYKANIEPDMMDDMDNERIQVRPFNLVENKNMRELNPEDIDSLVSIKGMVIRCGAIIPEMRTAFFKCLVCENTSEVAIEEGEINEPTTCSNCQSRYTMQLIHNRGTYADKQLVRIQETPDDIPEGETPHTVTVFAFDDLVDVCKPGDRVEITGVYKARSVRTNPRKRTIRSLFVTYIDAIHFKKTQAGRIAAESANESKASEFHTSFEESDKTQADIDAREEQLREYAQDPNIYKRLTKSLAPSVWEMDDVKKGILCLLFGGANGEKGAKQGRFRGEINVLMCGDPGTSKSQLLQYVHKIAPRGIYTSGKGSSAVGLTATITKDPETREMVLESGALVLSDRGVCCIDEFDKMSDSTRSILHEVMEQQTVSVAKAGIVCTLNARTSILASANPRESRYNPSLSVVQNIQLMPTLLSRFDLIYLILDQPNPARDRKLARHLVSMYYADVEVKANDQDILPMIDLTEYIALARRTVTPKMSPEASQLLVETYVEMRKQGYNAEQKVVTATPRQLESLIRLSEALARMKFQPIVTADEVIEAKRLMNVATQTAATDPRTGRIDMDLLATGVSSSDRKRLEQQQQAVRMLLESMDRGAKSIRELLEQFNEQSSISVPQNEFLQVLDALRDDGYLRYTGTNQQNVVRV